VSLRHCRQVLRRQANFRRFRHHPSFSRQVPGFPSRFGDDRSGRP
jgi:hypothetical protein